MEAASVVVVVVVGVLPLPLPAAPCDSELRCCCWKPVNRMLPPLLLVLPRCRAASPESRGLGGWLLGGWGALLAPGAGLAALLPYLKLGACTQVAAPS